MRFSDIVKTKEGLPESMPQIIAQPKKVQPPVTKTSFTPTQKIVAPTDQAKLESDLREKLNQEWQVRLEAIQIEAQRMMENKLQDNMIRLAEREKSLGEEQKKIQAFIEQIHAQNQQLHLEKERLRLDLEKKLSDEQQKNASHFDREREALQKTILELQQKLNAENTRSAQIEMKSVVEDARKQLLPAIDKPAPKLVDGLPMVAPSMVDTPKTPETSAKLNPYLPPVKPKAVLETGQDIEAYKDDPHAAAQARKVYHDLIHQANLLFDMAAQGKSIDVQGVVAPIERMIELASKRDSDFVRIVFESYSGTTFSYGHAANTCIISVLIGMDLKFRDEKLKDLALAAFFHDISLAGLKSSNYDAPELSKEAKNEVYKHSEKSAEMVQPYVSEQARKAIEQHHEFCNGKGYPKMLQDEQICMEAKIIHIADAFEAMTHERPYRKDPLEVSQAVKEIVEKGRGFYDRDAIKVLMSRIGIYPVGSLVHLSTKQIARVMHQNRNYPMSPIVQNEFDEAQNPLKQPILMNLVKNPLIHVVGATKAPSPDSPARPRSHQHRVDSKKKKGFNLDFASFAPYMVGLMVLLGLAYLVFKI